MNHLSGLTCHLVWVSFSTTPSPIHSDDDSSEEESSSDSSSESDPEVESDSSASSTKSSLRGPINPPQASTSTPMSRETRDRLMAQLTTFYETGDAGGSRFAGEDGLDENGEGYVTADSDELEDEGEVDMGLGWEAGSEDDKEGKGRFVEVDDDDEDEEDSSDEDDGPAINLMEMEDSDDEAGGAGGSGEPPKTKHEVEDDRAVVPDVQVLPDGERLVLAGEVMSVILHVKPVEAEAQAEVAVTVVSGVSKEEGDGQVVPEIPSAADEGKPESEEVTAEEAAVGTVDSAPSSSVPAKPAATGPKQTKAMKQKAKKEQKQRDKSSGTIVVKALRPPLETEGLGGLRIGDDEGWLEEGSLICLEDRRVLAVVSNDDAGRYSCVRLTWTINASRLGRRDVWTAHSTVLSPSTTSRAIPPTPCFLLDGWDQGLLPCQREPIVRTRSNAQD